MRRTPADSSTIRLGVIADIHLAPPGTPPARWHGEFRPDAAHDLLDRGLCLLAVEPIDALLLLGDLAHLGDAVSMAAVLGRVSTLGLPVWVTPGNHDVAQDAGTLGDVASAAGVRVATDLGEQLLPGLRLAGLSISSPDGGATCHVTSHLSATAWGSDAVLLLSHFPLRSRRAEAERAGWKYAGDLRGSEEEWRDLPRRAEPTVVFHGHLHLRDAFTWGTALQLGFAALAESGNEVTVVDIAHVEPALTVTVRPLPQNGKGLPSTTPVLDDSPGVWTYERERWRHAAPAPVR